MKTILIGGFAPLLFTTSLLAAQQQPAAIGDQAAAVRRLAATAQLAAQEYRVGVIDGRIVAQPEVDEARLFLLESRRSAAGLPVEVGRPAVAQIDSLLALVNGIASPDTVAARVCRLASAVSTQLGVALDELPAQPPSLARGAEVYRADCAGCHGDAGRGDGSAGVGLDPPPANLADAEGFRDQSPLDFYRRINIGVVGTAMPAFEGRLSAEDRWAVALYASTLRLPTPQGDVPPGLSAFATTGKMSDAALLAALGESGAPGDAALAKVAAVRTYADTSVNAAGAVFARVREQLDSAYALARRGDPGASAHAFDAYMTFEQVERAVRAKNPALAAELEVAFAEVRAWADAGATSQLAAAQARLAAGLENAERELSRRSSAAGLFTQSFVILLREGLEAILIIGALLTFLTKMGAAHRRRDVHLGIGAAVLASLLTAAALETIFHLTPAKQEALEGITMVVATAVLFYVSYWLLSKMEVVRWNHFVKSKVHGALSSGSSFALASAAFLAVYREGFETVLFYKALFVSAGPGGGAMPVAAGMLAGAVVMAGVYLAINRFGVRLPLKPFFGVTSAFLYYTAFVFAGQGMAELQEAEWVSTTVVSWAPRVPALGIYPTFESLAAQGVLVMMLVVALVWTFAVAPAQRGRRADGVAEAEDAEERVVATRAD